MLNGHKASMVSAFFVAAVFLMPLTGCTDLGPETGTGASGLLGDLLNEEGSGNRSESSASSSTFDASETYTSVIIDARGLDVEASMSPQIYSESGEELYLGGIPVDPDFAVNEGIAAFVYGSLDEAKGSSRAGDAPLLIKATAADGRFGVKISDADAANLRQADGKSLLLSHYKVIFLLD